MASELIISSATPAGALSIQIAAQLTLINADIVRLNAMIAEAASGYAGTAGTEYEGNATNFGVVASATPGAQGLAFAYAWGTINTAWTTFWTAASASIEAVDQAAPI